MQKKLFPDNNLSSIRLNNSGCFRSYQEYTKYYEVFLIFQKRYRTDVPSYPSVSIFLLQSPTSLRRKYAPCHDPIQKQFPKQQAGFHTGVNSEKLPQILFENR